HRRIVLVQHDRQVDHVGAAVDGPADGAGETGSVDRPPGLLSIDDLLLADPDRKDLRPGGEPAEAHSGLGAGGDDARDSGPVSDAVEGAVTSAVEEVSAAKDPPGQ